MVLLVGLPALAGCLQDLERQKLSIDWTAEATLYEGPGVLVEGWPAMLVVRANVTAPGQPPVEVTGVHAEGRTGNGTLDLEPARLLFGDQVLAPGSLGDETVLLEDGEALTMAFLPEAASEPGLPVDATVNLSVEVQWRYRDGNLFDAGKLELTGNHTVLHAPGLGVGAVSTGENRVQQLVFPGPLSTNASVTARVQVFAIQGDGQERLGPFEATFRAGEGVVLGDPASPPGIPEGHGYLVLVVSEPGLEGAAVAPFGTPPDATPWPGAVVMIAVLACLSVAAAGRRSQR